MCPTISRPFFSVNGTSPRKPRMITQSPHGAIMLQVTGLRKSYGNLVAVDGVSLRAGKGETIGLLGPNGAGKTTTVSMIAGLLRPDSGEVLIDGRRLQGDTDTAKRNIGLVPQ